MVHLANIFDICFRPKSNTHLLLLVITLRCGVKGYLGIRKRVNLRIREINTFLSHPYQLKCVFIFKPKIAILPTNNIFFTASKGSASFTTCFSINTPGLTILFDNIEIKQNTRIRRKFSKADPIWSNCHSAPATGRFNLDLTTMNYTTSIGTLFIA